MAIAKTMVFIDGENLVMRYQAMLAQGSEPADGVIYEPDVFVWHPQITTFAAFDIVRVSYYTSVVGDDDRLKQAMNIIAKVIFTFRGDVFGGTAQVYPRVFKKLAQRQKTRSVDINIVIDIMRYAYSDAVDQIFLVSGDGDYLPLINEVMRHGKQVMVGALSSGLNDDLIHNVDEFIDLDKFFFKPQGVQAP